MRFVVPGEQKGQGSVDIEEPRVWQAGERDRAGTGVEETLEALVSLLLCSQIFAHTEEALLAVPFAQPDTG
jgi:hypothetical protein